MYQYSQMPTFMSLFIYFPLLHELWKYLQRQLANREREREERAELEIIHNEWSNTVVFFTFFQFFPSCFLGES
jgi:hypothetical protein